MYHIFTQFRWKDDRSFSDSRGGGYGGRYSTRGGYYQRDGPSRDTYSHRINEFGFHGDLRPNPRVEDDLFFRNETQSAGINFDKVSSNEIPICVLTSF